MKRLFLSLMILVLLIPLVYGQNIGTTGGYGLFHTYQSRSYEPGRYEVYTNVNFYSKSHAWLWAGNLAFTTGIFDNLDITLASRFYQTTNYPDGKNAPNDLFITLKAGSFTFQKGRYVLGLMAQGRVPIGDSHNYPYAEYASGSFEYGIKGAFSYYSNPYLAHRSVSVHFNIGYWNHNEKDKEVPLPNDTTFTATKSSSKIDIAFGTIIPLSTYLDIRLELYGWLFTSLPDGPVYSAEDYAIFTPSVQYRPLNWLAVDLGIDLRLNPGERNRTSGAPIIDSPMADLNNYPPWKVHIGLHFNLTPHKKRNLLIDADRPEVKKMVEFYDMIEKEKEKSRDSENNVRELSKERSSAEKELKVIKKSLEGDD